MINTDEIPILMDKLWSSIDKVKDQLLASDYDVKRTGQSRIFYGFPVVRSWGDVWVQYYHNCWRDYRTPYMLQIRADWIREGHQAEKFKHKLQSIGFTFDRDLEYIFPVRVDGNDLVGCILSVAREKIGQIDELFE